MAMRGGLTADIFDRYVIQTGVSVETDDVHYRKPFCVLIIDMVHISPQRQKWCRSDEHHHCFNFRSMDTPTYAKCGSYKLRSANP